MTNYIKYRLKYAFCILIFVFQIIAFSSNSQPVTKLDTVTILSFNDFHGSFFKTASNPGASTFVNFLLNEKNTNPNSLILCGGDIFSGNYFTRITRGGPMAELFDTLGVSVSVVGNHEFDYGIPYLRDTVAKYVDLISANVVNKSDSSYPGWLKPYKIISQPLKNGDSIRIAVVGLTTIETPVMTLRENVKDFIFVDSYDAAQHVILNLLPKEKPDMILILMHIATDGNDKDIITEEDAKQLPYIKGLDAIISAHSHYTVFGLVNQVPIIQARCYGKYIAKLQFELKKKRNGYKVNYIGGDTIKVFGDYPQSNIDKFVEMKIKEYGLDTVITEAKDNIIHEREFFSTDKYSAMGALVTSSFVDCYEKYTAGRDLGDTIIVGINHSGGIRDNFIKGNVTILDAGNILPFSNPIVAYNFTGKRFKELMNSSRNNKNGCLQSSYLSLNIKDDLIDKMFYTKDGKIIEINDDTPCIVVLDNFIVDGGDGYDANFFNNYEINDFNSKEIITTDYFIKYLKSLEYVSTSTIAIPVESYEK